MDFELIFVARHRGICFPRFARSSAITRRLLTSTIISGGLLLMPLAAYAGDFAYTGPASTGSAETNQIKGTGTAGDKVTVTTAQNGTVTTTNTNSIVTNADSGE
ncbi:MAG: hypothetical protein EBU00_03785, partial [Alphaproteobacteria bacterium]|nr:hypothetical protein [Alphaproteobacteria bacterium]